MPSPQPTFGGLHVAAFESRRAKEMARLIEKFGGVAHVSPSMREVPVDRNQAAIDFAHQVITGQVDVIIFMTGVGTRNLVAQVERHVGRTRFLAAVGDITSVARGPKPVAALKELGIEPTLRVAEPNTWREILTTLDDRMSVTNQTVGIQEYGEPSPGLVAGLEARGARVISVSVYKWELPEDTEPLERNIRAICDEKIDLSLFTSAHQVVNLLELAGKLGLADQLKSQMKKVTIGSIGPTTTEALIECGLHSSFEPEHAKMGHLVATAADRSAHVLQKKSSAIPGDPTVINTPPAFDSRPAWQNSLFLRACRRESVERTPIWLMRQAGRFLPEYRAIRKETSFLDLCKDPRRASEVMLMAVEKLGVDAAIIFSDLLPILEPMGLKLEYSQGDGPVIMNPVREATAVNRVRELEDMAGLEFVTETVRLTRQGLPDGLPLIGFAGAPFTLVSYLVEGGASRNFVNTKRLMFTEVEAWNVLMRKVSRSVAIYLNAQIAAGAQAVQIFDSWAGCLSPAEYRQFVMPHTKSVLDALPRHIPSIHFATGNPALLPLMKEAGGTVMGIDWRIDIDKAWQTIGFDTAIQGNLDPTVLLADPATIRREAQDILTRVGRRAGHIFNLGHGVLPSTSVEHVQSLVLAVGELSSR